MRRPSRPRRSGLMSADRFAPCGTGAVYLNAARAALHDLDALTKALASGHLAAAGLDHFEGEALATDHPLVGLPNVVLTPHIGGATYDTEANPRPSWPTASRRCCGASVPANLANPEVLDRG